MYARVTRCTISPEETDSARDIFERVIPSIQEVDGYRGSVVFGNERSVVVVTLWDSAEHMAQSKEFGALLRRAETAHRGWEAGETADYEVLVSDLRR